MKFIALPQRRSPVEFNRAQADQGLFMGKVEFVDYERLQLAVRDVTKDILYERVEIFPSKFSSYESTEVTMPEEGAYCICGNISSEAGFVRVAVIDWVISNSRTGLDAIAHRVVNKAKGKNYRKRGVFRKVYPGQVSVALKTGYSSKISEGWDYQTADLSRDKLDSDSRTRTEITGTHIRVDESGISISGLIERPDSDLVETTLANGETRQYAYLKGEGPASRFESGDYQAVPLVEKLTRVNEFGLDYPVPLEIVRDKLLPKALGTGRKPFEKTKVNQNGDLRLDDNSYYNVQTVDTPYDTDEKPVGSSLNDSVSYVRKGHILEHVAGTLVGYNQEDTSTYGKVLKPVLFPSTKLGRFATSVESGYLPVNRSEDEVETLLAASALSVRFPYEYNTTRFDVTKEGLFNIEIGSTLPKEKIPVDNSTYEHPHGAGRSLNLHAVGSAKMVFGKNRDEEESLDLTALGQVVLRLGADDSSLPGTRRTVMTQTRSQADTVLARTMQFWDKAKLAPGDAGNLETKSGAENISLRGAFDGGTVLRLGARSISSKRRHLFNGYKDGQGKTAFGVDDPGRKDSKTDGRQTYGTGDSVYAFHNLANAGKPNLGLAPYFYSGPAVQNMDAHGLSLDLHAVRDVLLRAGKNPESGNSVMIDLGGGMTACLGTDNKGRSITASLDGGAEITIRANNEGRALQLEIDGDVNIVCKGNWHQYVTGDYFLESTNATHITKLENVTKAMNIRQGAMVQHVSEAPDIVHNQGNYKS